MDIWRRLPEIPHIRLVADLREQFALSIRKKTENQTDLAVSLKY